MSVKVKNWIKSCHSCMQRRGHKSRKFELLQRQDIPVASFSKIAIDIVGSLSATERGNRYIINLIDHFTRWCEAYPISNIASPSVAKALMDLIASHGSPDILVSDKGSNLIAETMASLYRTLGIKTVQTTAYHPQSNGLLEVYHRSLGSALSHLVNDNQLDWDERIKLALFACKTTWHSATRHSPAFLVYGRELNVPYKFLESPQLFTFAEYDEFSAELRNQLKSKYNIVNNNLIRAAEKQENQRLAIS
ncbi:Retrovirus-related Pol polyprotein from transposon 412 [Araneus ventricosus]|uniref:Retrovirus-related Pol polyprotein from transposon 412 n=1 Tax=Araneus ventricosus TaxID=182803 RepID=A0A4Y2TLF6_ARAVE|nr:Retrovirus-related Pol polyprotein from transposon 412 [Araneus ventricosus]